MYISVFAFSRAIAFANANGFYLMSGATPQKISDKLDGLFPQMGRPWSAAGFCVRLTGLLDLADTRPDLFLEPIPSKGLP